MGKYKRIGRVSYISGVIISQGFYSQFRNFTFPIIECEKSLEELTFNFKSINFDGTKNFITSIPELKLLYFYSTAQKSVNELNLETGKHLRITLDDFYRIKSISPTMSNKVSLFNRKGNHDVQRKSDVQSSGRARRRAVADLGIFSM